MYMSNSVILIIFIVSLNLILRLFSDVTSKVADGMNEFSIQMSGDVAVAPEHTNPISIFQS